jgi:hypothetical protein
VGLVKHQAALSAGGVNFGGKISSRVWAVGKQDSTGRKEIFVQIFVYVCL